MVNWAPKQKQNETIKMTFDYKGLNTDYDDHM